MASADWIEWTGGRNPTAVTAVVEVRHRDGGLGTNRIAAETGDWDHSETKGWVHNGSGYDIVAYREFAVPTALPGYRMGEVDPALRWPR